ncbi:hypothetical protein [Jannaschia sp. LMIT008]|uniref:hypothetical protein n=1 Tax=Jannaschia maritima TaxID=3032585 RepID=UPI0028117ABA|nr:hypothetical protein [Jannaschia sp. LMIT008]
MTGGEDQEARSRYPGAAGRTSRPTVAEPSETTGSSGPAEAGATALKNARHERFARALAAGLSGVDSVVEANEGIRRPSEKEMGYRLRNRSDVRARVQWLQRQASTDAETIEIDTAADLLRLLGRLSDHLREAHGRLRSEGASPADLQKISRVLSLHAGRTLSSYSNSAADHEAQEDGGEAHQAIIEMQARMAALGLSRPPDGPLQPALRERGADYCECYREC